MKILLLATLFLLTPSLILAQQGSLSAYQKSILDYWYAQAKTNGIDGAWIIAGTVEINKLSTNLQQIILLPFQIDTVTSNVTLNFSQRTILVNTSSGSVNVALPSSSVVTGMYYEIKFTTGTNLCNVIPSTGEEIDGKTGPFKLFLGESISIQADGGSKWLIL